MTAKPPLSSTALCASADSQAGRSARDPTASLACAGKDVGKTAAHTASVTCVEVHNMPACVVDALSWCAPSPFSGTHMLCYVASWQMSSTGLESCVQAPEGHPQEVVAQERELQGRLR